MCICRVKAPSRVAFFAWTAAMGKIFTIDNLCRIGIIILDLCCTFKQDGESVDHHYNFA